MKKNEVIKDILELWAEEAAEKIYDKYIAKTVEGTGSVTVNVSDSYCKICGGLLPHIRWWASTAEPKRCHCPKDPTMDFRNSFKEYEDSIKEYNRRMAQLKEMLYTPTTVQRCPVCEGRTVVPAGFYTPIGYNFSGTSCSPETCKACNGTGIIKT